MPNQKSAANRGTTREVTMRDLVAPVFRHRRLVIGAFATTLVLSLVVAWGWAARYYQAKMQVLVEQDRSDPAISTGPEGTAAPPLKPLTTDQISSEVALLQGEDMLRSVAETCGLPNSKSTFDFMLPKDPAARQSARIEKAAMRLGTALSVDAEKNSDVINVKYGRTGNPRTPACVLQTLSKLYLQKHLELRRPPGSTDFFAQQADKYQKALADAETRLAEFSQQAGVAAPDELRSDMAQQVANTEALLYQTKQAVAGDEQRIKDEQGQITATPERSATQEESNAANILLQQLETTLLTSQNNRQQLLMKYDPSYPLVREADQEIAKTEDAIQKAKQTRFVNQTTDRDPTYELLREDLAKTQADLAAQQASANALVAGIRSMHHEMVDLDAKALEQGALLREEKADETNYLLYVGKREQERASDALDARRIADVAIAVPAVVPALPAYSPMLVSFIGFLLAICAGMSSGFVADYLDPSFRTPEEVSDILKIPVLASMPRRAA
jgi:uncharacterized protein involved in exopolysaccharide biosynthesis